VKKCFTCKHPSSKCRLHRNQGVCRVPHLSCRRVGPATTARAAELRSARTGEGARPHTAGGAAKAKAPLQRVCYETLVGAQK
jgi:hypothetical protein